MNDQDVRRHKGTGIASFVISLVVLICVILLFVTAGAMTNAGSATATSNTVVGSAIFLFWLVALIGIGLGIAGCVGHNVKKSLAVWELIINAAVLVISVILVLIGLRMAGG